MHLRRYSAAVPPKATCGGRVRCGVRRRVSCLQLILPRRRRNAQARALPQLRRRVLPGGTGGAKSGARAKKFLLAIFHAPCWLILALLETWSPANGTTLRLTAWQQIQNFASRYACKQISHAVLSCLRFCRQGDTPCPRRARRQRCRARCRGRPRARRPSAPRSRWLHACARSTGGPGPRLPWAPCSAGVQVG